MPPQPQYTTQHRFPTSQRPEKRERAVPGWAIIGVFLILLFHFVTAASAFLMPVSLGILLFFVFVPFRRLMDRLGIGATVTAAIVTLGMVALVAVLGGLDMLVFTAGIGEHNVVVRERVCAGLAYLGIALDTDANGSSADCISSPASRIPVAVERTNEEWVAAWHACRLLEGQQGSASVKA